MLGGPFIDYGPERASDIRQLRDQTVTKRAPLIELSRDLATLDSLLIAQAGGCSLLPLYPHVPDSLKGRVELSYDLDHRARFRLIEPLFYESEFYDSSSQSLRLSIVTGDDRPFVMSTPRLESADAVELRTPFASQIIDDLFKLKTEPRKWPVIVKMLGDTLSESGAKTDVLRSLFTTRSPAPYNAYCGRGVRWRYFGHACILIESSTVSILSDPVLSYTYETDISRYTYADLPEIIDYVVITHNHQDHILLETLLQIRHKVRNVLVPRSSGGDLQDPSLRLTLEKIGFKNVRELSELEVLQFEGGAIMGVPFLGEHGDLDIRTKMAYLVRIGRHSLLLAADSCNIEPELYECVHQLVGDLDVLFIGMECEGAPVSWLYGPLFTAGLQHAADQSRRLNGSNFEQAWSIVQSLKCKEVYVYAMGQEPWLNYIMSIRYTPTSRPIVESNRLIEICQSNGKTAERLFGEKEILLP